jgi:hypothetical protein
MRHSVLERLEASLQACRLHKAIYLWDFSIVETDIPPTKYYSGPVSTQQCDQKDSADVGLPVPSTSAGISRP